MRTYTQRAEAWRRWTGRRGSPSGLGLSPAGQPGQSRKVELQLAGAWVDITDYVRYQARITITGGRSDRASQVEACTCSMTLANGDGRFSYRNPLGAWYGLLGRNTPIRVSVYQAGTYRYRFHGEVAAWPPGWDKSGRDAWVTVAAAGIMRRLGQGTPPTLSPYRHAVYRSAGLVAYWPMEDAAGSTSLASGIGGGTAMRIARDGPTFGASTAFACSEPLPQMSDGEWIGAVGAYAAGSSTQIRFPLDVPSTGAADAQVLVRTVVTGAISIWDVTYNTAGSGTLTALAYDSTGLIGASFSVSGVNGRPVLVSLGLVPDGAFTDATLSIMDAQTGAITTSGPSPIGGVTGVATRCIVDPGGGLLDTGIGHLSVHALISPLGDVAAALTAGVGESAGRRIQRLCAEEGINFAPIGDLDDTAAMGAQSSAALLDLLREAADADMGLLHEPRDQLGIAYRTRTSLYNQAARLTLDMAGGDLADPPDPPEDDRDLRNDVTATRTGGSSARATLDAGPLSTLPPPDGAGRYPDTPTISVESDDDLPDQAAWRLLLGTVDEVRIPTVAVDLLTAAFAGDEGRTSAVLTTGLGDRIVLTNPPAQLPPDSIEQIAQGFTETIGDPEHKIVFSCTPGSPYRVATADDDVLGRADTDGSQLAADASATTTTLSVATTSGPLWTTDPAEMPIDVITGGEDMTVTAITGSSSPQTFTVTRAINGVAKAQTAGTDVRMAHSMIPGL